MLVRALTVAAVVVLTGCSTGADGAGGAAENSSNGRAPEDPMAVVSDPASEEFVPDAEPLVHDLGRGPVEVPLTIPRGADAVRVYLSCAPAADFTVNYGTFYSGPCTERFASWGQFDREVAGSSTSLTVDIPENVQRWLVILPINEQDPS